MHLSNIIMLMLPQAQKCKQYYFRNQIYLTSFHVVCKFSRHSNCEILDTSLWLFKTVVATCFIRPVKWLHKLQALPCQTNPFRNHIIHKRALPYQTGVGGSPRIGEQCSAWPKNSIWKGTEKCKGNRAVS